MFKGWIAAIFTIIVWGVTFASTRALLEDFSSLEILVLRFSLAWVALWMLCATKWRRARSARPTCAVNVLRGEWIFAAMGFTGIVAYQFLENCAIYYTNASNVAILVSFGPIVTALMARAFARGGQFSLRLVAGSIVALKSSEAVSSLLASLWRQGSKEVKRNENCNDSCFSVAEHIHLCRNKRDCDCWFSNYQCCPGEGFEEGPQAVPPAV